MTQGQSGIEENRTELDEILSSLAEERDDFVSKKRRMTEKQEARTKNLENAGDVLVSTSLRRGVKRTASKSDTALTLDDEDGLNEVFELRGDSSSSLRQTKKRKKSLNHSYEHPDTFSSALQSADMARLDINKERLVFERERFQTEIEERKLERKEREQERIMENRREEGRERGY
jgi:hypothetical protein